MAESYVRYKLNVIKDAGYPPVHPNLEAGICTDGEWYYGKVTAVSSEAIDEVVSSLSLYQMMRVDNLVHQAPTVDLSVIRADMYKVECDPLLTVVDSYETELTFLTEGTDEYETCLAKLNDTRNAWWQKRQEIRAQYGD